MTSGNLTDEPICYEDADARARLGNIADAWLVHDRPIHVPCDDSVVRIGDGDDLPIRRSRGYAPLPVRLPFEVAPVLAMGGELKNTFCLASGREAWVSQHIGDMGSLETLAAFERSTRQFGDMYAVDPECIVADAHPGYQTRRWAEEQAACDVALVHHHHAHIAAVMVEHGVPADERVIGFAFDGTGYGTDGAIWGGEVLVAGYDGFERPLHLRYVPLPGGDATIRKPYRAALAHLWAAGIAMVAGPPARPTRHRDTNGRCLRSQLEQSVHCVPTSSMGRLFDAVSSLLGVRHEASYEAQAAMELEWAASRAPGRGPALSLRHRPAVRSIQRPCSAPSSATCGRLCGRSHGRRLPPRRGRPHGADRRSTSAKPRASTGSRSAVASSRTFSSCAWPAPSWWSADLEVLTHRLVPPNDGGLALGQAAVAGRAEAERSRAR